MERLQQVEEALNELPLPGGQAALPLPPQEGETLRLPPDLSDPGLTAPEVVLRVLRHIDSWASASMILKVARDGGFPEENKDLLHSALSRMARPDDGRLEVTGEPPKRFYRPRRQEVGTQ